MTGEQLFNELPNCVGYEFWIAVYNFKEGGSNYMYGHVRPTLARVHIIDTWGRSGRITMQELNPKTGEPIHKYHYFQRNDGIFRTREEAVEFYKERLQAHIADKEAVIEKQRNKIEVLREKINTFE